MTAGVLVSMSSGVVSIRRWFNNVNGVAPTLSGDNGNYTLNMGFDTRERYVSCTVDTNVVATRNANCVAGVSWFSGTPNNSINIRIWDPEDGYTKGGFYLLVY